MIKTTLTLCTCLFVVFTLQSQSKKELIAEVQSLKSELDSTQAALTESKKNESVSKARAESVESELVELRDANALLLKNLKTFTEASTQRSDNIGKTLESLREKEAQLKVIRDAIGANDSTAVVVLTNAKQTLGENAKIGVSNGAIIIASDLTSLFGSDTGTDISAEGEAWLEKIAAILNANPAMSLTVEGLTMTGDLTMAANQASTVSSVLQKNFGIAPERMVTLGKDGNFKEGINLKIHPRFDQFYLMVRENMKN